MMHWWLLLFSGMLGSSHCIGMCGGFALLVGMNTGSFLANLRKQLVYSSGRLMSYVTLGAVAGTAGRQTINSLPSWINVPAILCLISGAFLLCEGLINLGIWNRAIRGQSIAGCLMRPLFSATFRRPALRAVFVAGILTGLLPCGLVYAFISLAASSGDFGNGAATMAAFGCGTVPLMVFTGTGASLLDLTSRQRLLKLSAICVIATGLLTCGRGIAYLQARHDATTPTCPFCAAKSSSPAALSEGRRP